MASTGRFQAGGAQAVRAQCAALCWRMGAGAVEVLLVTSRDTGRWIVPKGWLVRGMTAAESAAREAYEEAGVSGRIDARGIGSFGYDKVLGARGKGERVVPCLVSVFPLSVEAQTDRFPEAAERHRAWFPQADAATLVTEPDLRRMIANFVPEAPSPTVSQPA